MKKYVSRIVCVVLLAFCIVSFANIETASAGNFETLAETGILQLGKDEKYEKQFDTKDGVFKIRLRKLRLGPDRKRYHVIIWRNDERILDGYCPQNDLGYGISVFRGNTSNRLFFCVSGLTRTELFGYERKNNKIEKYIDSRDYYSPYPWSAMVVDADNDLRLITTDGESANVQYKFFWVPSKNWFGYKDVSVYPSTPSYDEGEDYSYDEESETSYDDGTIYEAPQTTASADDIFYEDVDVVGS